MPAAALTLTTAHAAIFNRLERRAPDPKRPHKKSKHPIEHFGYLDGVSQPMIKGLPRAKYAKEVRPETYRLHAVEPGEFVLGEKNEEIKPTRIGDAIFVIRSIRRMEVLSLVCSSLSPPASTTSQSLWMHILFIVLLILANNENGITTEK